MNSGGSDIATRLPEVRRVEDESIIVVLIGEYLVAWLFGAWYRYGPFSMAGITESRL